jgi:hypothetical protein
VAPGPARALAPSPTRRRRITAKQVSNRFDTVVRHGQRGKAGIAGERNPYRDKAIGDSPRGAHRRAPGGTLDA